LIPDKVKVLSFLQSHHTSSEAQLATFSKAIGVSDVEIKLAWWFTYNADFKSQCKYTSIPVTCFLSVQMDSLFTANGFTILPSIYTALEIKSGRPRIEQHVGCIRSNKKGKERCSQEA
jgi:hypothetical protein